MLLVQEGRGDGALLLARSDSSRVARRRWATAGEAVASVEQSSEERGRTMGEEKHSGWRLPR
jgi:hypothetical protein